MAAVAERTPPPQAPASDDPELEFLASGTLARRQPAAGNAVAGSGSEAAAAGPAGRPTRQFYFRQNADYDSLIEACSRKLAAQPGNTRALMIRANAFAKKGERLAMLASAACMVATTADGPGPLGLALLNRWYALYACAAGLLPEAVADYTAVLAAEPANVDAAYKRGAAHHKLGALEAAIADYTTALSLDPRHAKAAYGRAACNNLAGNFDAANGEGR